MKQDPLGGQIDRQSPRQSGASELAPAASPTQPPALLTERSMRRALGDVGERKFHQLRAAGIVPEPLLLGPRAPRWTHADLAETIARLPRRERAPEPESLAQGRRRRIAELKGRGA